MLGARRLLRTVRARDPDLIVSTYPGTTAVLGELRKRGRLDTPVVSAITDLAGLRFWAHPGVDLHTVTYRESLEEVEAIAGPGSARWARPPTSPAFLRPVSQADARRRLGLPARGKVVVVSGGGWGIGDLAGAVETALEVEGATVVCLAGRSERARRQLVRRFGSNPRVRLLGFTEAMSDLLGAADALVHSTAGLTVLEAQIRGCPVISYGFAVGHIRANNRAYERFGLATVATSVRALRAELERALVSRPDPDPVFAALPSPATLALEARPRERSRRSARRRAARFATATALAFLFAWELLLTDDVYPLFAKVLDAGPMTAVATTRPEVGLLIDVSGESAASAARQLSRRGLKASFAFSESPGDGTLLKLRELGDGALPRLAAGGPFHSLGTKGRLTKDASGLGLGKGFMYQPGSDFTPTQYLLARAAGGSPVEGAAETDPGDAIGALRPGEVIQINIDGQTPAWRATIDSLDSRLAAGGLRTVTLPELVSSGGN